MTPTLLGRWQTRFFTYITLGLLVTLCFVLIDRDHHYFWVLAWLFLFGIGWDMLYIFLQKFRWERDWPAMFFWICAGWEGLVVKLFLDHVGLPGLPKHLVGNWQFIFHYGLVWTVIFIWIEGPMRMILPYWRFHGGRLFPRVAGGQRGVQH